MMLKYESIYQSILMQIQSGIYATGAKLPSIRNLTEQYHCSKSTVLTAYYLRLTEKWLLCCR